jgi:hypothetical protein
VSVNLSSRPHHTSLDSAFCKTDIRAHAISLAVSLRSAVVVEGVFFAAEELAHSWHVHVMRAVGAKEAHHGLLMPFNVPVSQAPETS